MNQDEDNLQCIAKTIFGLEEVLASELKQLGARDVEILNRAVKFSGDKGFMYKANLCLHTALRILIPIAQIEVENEVDLYTKIKAINWEEYLDVNQTFAIDTVLNTNLFNHSQFISQKTKDAIADFFREKHGIRPSVQLKQPDVKINLHIFNTTCNIALDSSGDSLHKRNYRNKTNIAPINEVLAAGLILLSGWDKRHTFIDPMCGSGTLLIEAALLAAGIPAGYYREDFGLMHWKHFLKFDADLWQTILNASISKIKEDVPLILGGEISHHVTRKAKENLKWAKVEDIVKIYESSIQEFSAPDSTGTLIINPPYGERMNQDDVQQLYQSIGDSFKKIFFQYDCWLITSNEEGLKHVGLRPSRKIKIFNGQLPCWFMNYKMYQGTKKIHKLINTSNP